MEEKIQFKDFQKIIHLLFTFCHSNICANYWNAKKLGKLKRRFEQSNVKIQTCIGVYLRVWMYCKSSNQYPSKSSKLHRNRLIVSKHSIDVRCKRKHFALSLSLFFLLWLTCVYIRSGIVKPHNMLCVWGGRRRRTRMVHTLTHTHTTIHNRTVESNHRE